MREERQRERDVLFWISITTYEIPITLRLTHQRKSEGWFMRSFCVVFVYVWSATSLCRDTQISPLVIIIILSVTGNCRFFWCNTDEMKTVYVQIYNFLTIECLNNSEFVFYVFFLQLPIIQTNVYIVLYVIVKRPNVAVV